VPALGEAEEDAGPGKDISINFVPVMYPLYQPAQMRVRPGEREFWRVLNASADTYFDLQVRFGRIIQDIHEVQPIELVAIDGAPLPAPQKRDHILLGPGARAEFIAFMPPPGVLGQLVTLRYDTGPDGAATPYRNIVTLGNGGGATPPVSAPVPDPHISAKSRDLAALKPVRERRLYFSEDPGDPKNPVKSIKYFITVEGRTPKTFDMNSSEPDIVAEQGTVEDWVIENRAQEAHTFHIHQLHFQVMERDGKRAGEPELRDTVDVPYWDGKSDRYPSVRLRMDFRNPAIVGAFVYHCHILEHEDGGMMGSIRVQAPKKIHSRASRPSL
jgi:FtsP/CotA-like multicopper oxidase with cupredoxin domain